MQCLYFDGSGVHFKQDAPLPIAKQGEVLIKVLRAGICSTDFEITKGYHGFKGILGHEFVGKVVDNNAPHYISGQIVAGEINIVCGDCTMCLNQPNIAMHHCPNRTVLGILHKDGCFAEYITLPVANLHIIPDTVSIREACFIEPLAAALQIQEQVHIGSQDRVLVVGDGKLAVLVAKTLITTGIPLGL